MMKKQYLVIIGILAVLMCVSSVMAIPIPGANRNAPQMIPLYSPSGELLSYKLDLSQGIQVSPTRIQSIQTSKSGKPLWYLETVKQGSYIPDYTELIISPYPEEWDIPVPLMRFYSSVEYTDYCIKNGVPKRGTYAIALRSGGWMR